MKESERIERELVKYKEKSEEFRQQLQSFREFKEELVKAGVYREDSYSVPLMHRLGDTHNVVARSRQVGDSE